jgi:hypothetical protein
VSDKRTKTAFRPCSKPGCGYGARAKQKLCVVHLAIEAGTHISCRPTAVKGEQMRLFSEVG